VAIVVLLAVVSAGLVFGLAEEEPAPPSAALELVPTEDPPVPARPPVGRPGRR
jgi:FlaG/FlaF family flagellin (archaellin)